MGPQDTGYGNRLIEIAAILLLTAALFYLLRRLRYRYTNPTESVLKQLLKPLLAHNLIQIKQQEDYLWHVEGYLFQVPFILAYYSVLTHAGQRHWPDKVALQEVRIALPQLQPEVLSHYRAQVCELTSTYGGRVLTAEDHLIWRAPFKQPGSDITQLLHAFIQIIPVDADRQA
jgi:hypothetical protein